MSNKPLLTMAVASMFAGEIFLMHANIHWTGQSSVDTQSPLCA